MEHAFLKVMTEKKSFDLILQSMGEKILRIWTLPIFRVQMGIKSLKKEWFTQSGEDCKFYMAFNNIKNNIYLYLFTDIIFCFSAFHVSFRAFLTESFSKI